MPTQLTSEDARLSMQEHAGSKGAEVRQKYGPRIGWGQLQRILADRSVTRYPCEIAFDSTPLESGECAFAMEKGEEPGDGFTIFVNPFFVNQPRDSVYLVLYQLVLVNYGPFASAEDAEAFGAAALGISIDEYYAAMCRIADQLR